MADETTNIEQQDSQELTPQQQGIQFEDILPWGTPGGDTGLSSRLKLKRNFEKIKAWIDSLDLSALIGDKYLSKKEDDTAEGFIRFIKGLQVGERFVTGLLGEGGVFRKDADGTTYLEADKMYVRMKAYFDTVEIRKFLHSGGNRIASVAGAKCVRVVPFAIYSGSEVALSEDYRYHWTTVDPDTGEEIQHQSAQYSDNPEATNHVEYYRCYFRGSDGDDAVTNDFIIGDQAYCHITNGDTQALMQHHYWRLVLSKSNSTDADGMHYIDLSNHTEDTLVIEGAEYKHAGFQTGSDVPSAQDDIVQLGNIADKTRQGAIIEYVSGEDAPSYQIYQGIDDFVLSGKNYIGIGYNSSTGRAYMNVYGDAYIGDRNRNAYMQYHIVDVPVVDPETGEQVIDEETGEPVYRQEPRLDIKARISVQSTVSGAEGGDQTFEEYINSRSVSKETIMKLIGDDLQAIQNQIDGSIETWFYNGVPSANTLPESEWKATDAEAGNNNKRLKHLGDLYYDNKTGRAYRYVNTGTEQAPVFSWTEISDSAVVEALKKAQDAQSTADGKRRVFVVQPTPPYDKGDLWVNATFDNGTIKYDDDILKCVTARDKNGSFAIADWTLASKYTDDSSLNTFLNGQYKTDLQATRNQIDGKAETWYQSQDPSTAWTTDKLQESHVGDLWYNTTNKKTFIYRDMGTSANPRYKWAEAEMDVPQEVFDKIDGKASIYTNTLQDPPTNYKENDLWIIPADYNINGVAYKKGEVLTATADSVGFNQAHWTKKVRYTDDAKFDGYINQILNGTGASGDSAIVANAIKAIKGALKEGTIIDGGLVLSSLINLRSNNKTWAGISGQYDASALGGGIAAWYGGAMVDKEVATTATDYAKSLFRFDGSGYLAGGNITWTAEGKVTIKDIYTMISGENSFTTNVLNKATLFSNLFHASTEGTSVGTETRILPQAAFEYIDINRKNSFTATDNSVLNYGEMKSRFMTSDLFWMLFDVYSGGDKISDSVKASGSVFGYSNVSIKANFGLWSNDFISALGKSEGGSASVFDEAAMWTALGGSIDNQQIAISHLTTALSGYVKGVKVGSTTYSPNGSGIVDLGTIEGRTYTFATGTTNGTFKVTPSVGDAYEVAIKGLAALAYKASLTAADIPNLDATKITTGILSADRIPGLSADKITSGTLSVDRIPDLSGKYVTTTFFNKLFRAQDASGNDITVNASTAVDSIKAMVGLWTEEYLSALGKNPAQGEVVVLNALLTALNGSGLAGHPSQSGQTVVWNGSQWTFGTAGGSGTVTAVKVGDTTYQPTNGVVSLPKYPTSLAWDKITGKPTTIGGYGITDAKIVDGVITLGTNTITPLTDAMLKSGYEWWGQKLDASGKVNGNITIQLTTVGSNTYADANPKLIFKNANGSQNISLTFTDYNAVAYPASLTLNGNQGNELFIAPRMKADRLYLYKPNGRGDTNAVFLEYDSANGGVHLVGAGFYADEYVSALGKGDSGTAGIDMSVVWSALAANTNEPINPSHLTTALSSYATQSWVTQQIASSATGGTVTAVKVGTTTYNPASGVVSLPAYLPLTGGTMSNTNLVANLNAELLNGLGSNDFGRRYTGAINANSGVKISFSNNTYGAIVSVRGTGSAYRLLLLGNGYGVGSSRNQWTCLDKGSGVDWCINAEDTRTIEVFSHNPNNNIIVDVLLISVGVVTFSDISALSRSAISDVVALTSQIPTNNNQLTNGAGYITSSGSITGNAATATMASEAARLTAVSKTAWGRTYWTDGGVPTSISGDMTGVGDITMSGNLRMANATAIKFKDSSGTNRLAFRVTSSNDLWIGEGFSASGYNTVLRGNILLLQTGTRHTNALTVSAAGLVEIVHNTQGLKIGDAYLVWDAANTALKVTGANGAAMNFYATGGVSALGMGGSGGGGGDYLPLTGGIVTGNIGVGGASNNGYALNVNGSINHSGGSFSFNGGTSSSGIQSNTLSISAYQFTLSSQQQIIIGSSEHKAGAKINGYAQSTAGFKKDGSSDGYVLLGGGGHKLLSEIDGGGGTSTSSNLSFAYNFNNSRYNNIEVYPDKILIRSNGFTYGEKQLYYIASTNNQDFVIDASWVYQNKNDNNSSQLVYIDKTSLQKNVRTDFGSAFKVVGMNSFMALPSSSEYEPFAVFMGDSGRGSFSMVGVFSSIALQSISDRLRIQSGTLLPEIGTFYDENPYLLNNTNSSRARIRVATDSFVFIKTTLYEMYVYMFDKAYSFVGVYGSGWVQKITRDMPASVRYINIAFRLKASPDTILVDRISELIGDIEYTRNGDFLDKLNVIPCWNVAPYGIYIDGDTIKTNANGFGVFVKNKMYYIAPTDRSTSYTFDGTSMYQAALCINLDQLTNEEGRNEPNKALSLVNIGNGISAINQSQIPIAIRYGGGGFGWRFIGAFSYFNKMVQSGGSIGSLPTHPHFMSQNLIAHRGYDVDAPENTIPSLQAAYEAGFKIVEIDIVQSSDGEQFCLHDATIDRTSNGSGNASSFTAAQLKSYDFGSWKAAKWAGTRIPTLKEALIFCKRHNLCIELDLADNARYSDSMLQKTYNDVKACGMLHQAMFTANLSRIASLQNIDPSVIVSISGMTSTSLIDSAIPLISSSRCANVSIPNASATAAMITYAHSIGAFVKTWYYQGSSQDNASNISTMFNNGCDYAITAAVKPSDLSY